MHDDNASYSEMFMSRGDPLLGIRKAKPDQIWICFLEAFEISMYRSLY